ncbi:MAG: HupE/UreJ family protein [Burkholderiales bacterium]|nr:HupE/UreJ family protein [Burkholderiales bacterium]
MMRRPLAAIAGAALLLVPGIAHAHLLNTGLGPVYDGISHLFLSVEDLLPVAAMALLAGLNGPVAGRRALFALPAAWLAGGFAGYLVAVAILPTGITALSLLVLGILTAADRRIRPAIVTALAAALGLLHGWLNGAAIATAGREAMELIGIAGAILVVAALVSALVVSLRLSWARIAVRVAGSWIAATGLLLLGWTLSGRL